MAQLTSGFTGLFNIVIIPKVLGIKGAVQMIVTLRVGMVEQGCVPGFVSKVTVAHVRPPKVCLLLKPLGVNLLALKPITLPLLN